MTFSLRRLIRVRCTSLSISSASRDFRCSTDGFQAALKALKRYRKSHAVELGDALIAASAVERGARLWTRNRKHYPMPELAFMSERLTDAGLLRISRLGSGK